MACASAFLAPAAVPGTGRYASAGNARLGLSLRGNTGKSRVQITASGKEPATIVDIVVGSPAHTTLKALVTRAGLVPALQGAGKFTLFAPTDAAFASLPKDATLVKKITADPISDNFKPLLQDILKYHVVSGVTTSSGLPASATSVDTLSTGSKLSVKNTAPQVSHVGGAGAASATAVDLMAGNGVVHVVDAVLLPPSTQRTVVSIATGAAPEFSTLVKLLVAADLVTTLSADGIDNAFTVFAPTNAAFAKVDANTVASLLKPENKAVLANLLKYHVVAGTVVSSALSDGQTITSLASGANTFKFVAAGTKLSTGPGSVGASITTVDLLGTNGVVHIVDSVLIPTDFKI